MASICSFSLICFIAIFSTSFQGSEAASDKSVFCYFGSWATYRWGIALFEVSNIDTTLCTHMVYMYTGLKNGEIASLDEYNDYEENFGKGNIKKFVTLAKNGGVKALVGIGGWNEGSVKYSLMAASAAGRETFADSAVAFIQKFGFDGLELDWEYPASNGGGASDKANYVLLLQTLSEKFAENNLILSVAVSASAEVAEAAYEFVDVAKFADHIILFSYDYHSFYDGVTAVSSPLTGDDKLNVNYSVHQWLDAGVPSNKIVIGVPLYGRTYHLADPSKHGLGAAVTGPGTAGQFTQEAGLLTYLEYCTSATWTVVQSDDPLYTYAYHDSEWISYDDPQTIEGKAQYVISNELGGMMVFSLESDDFGGNCGPAYPLLNAVNTGLGRL
ncbi:chitotriosidase-1-like [Periplaneta americana]|uniref:Chitinase n=1 Tax=Periplaneta americana TaxID=6978 RepID=A0A059WNC6_PERAM|nr:chitinase [Periplaneta americana]